MTRSEAEHILQRRFGLRRFYDEQWEAVERILNGERILMIQRTGFGKSLCYQFPATQFDGVTVIFSPLIALMRDQVKALQSKGIAAAYINSEQSPEDNQQAIEQALNGQLKILYIAPERQENEAWIEATRQMNLSMVVIDEAHTISTWGHDFRPAFRRIIDLVQLLPAHLPVLATTATATLRVQQDIERQIGGKLTTIRGNLVRENLYLRVIRVQSEDEKMLWLAENLPKIQGTGLIYTGTRVDTEIYAKWLNYNGINAIDYNAGFDAETRTEIENGLMANHWKCVVSTNALGMGIDKPDIRFIIHTQIPASPVHYYQEIGRAGRDGKPTHIVLFYNEAKNADNIDTDYRLPLSFIETARPTMNKYQKVIDLLQEEPLTATELMVKANLKPNMVRVIKADLIEQGIIREVKYDKTKRYEYQYNAPKLDTAKFEALRQSKIADLNAMVQYIYTAKPRMQYLCEFLDSNEQTFKNCDNTNLPKIALSQNAALQNKLVQFRETYFPVLELAEVTIDKETKLRIRIPRPHVLEVYQQKLLIGTFAARNRFADLPEEIREKVQELVIKHSETASKLTDGYAASYYGTTNIGTVLHRCKYENGGDFPDDLLRKTLRMFGKQFHGIRFDLVLYVPPTHSGDLVRHFAMKFAQVIKVPITHNLVKIRETQEQKIFQNKAAKRRNIADAFDIDEQTVKGKTILLIDDIYDSGATLQEIGKTLTARGAKYIVPIVIAKTVGGTL